MIRRLIILLLIVGCGTEPEDVYGCIDATACNYEGDADKDDGSCIAPQGYNEWCEGDDGCIDLAGISFPECGNVIGYGYYEGECETMYCSSIDGDGVDWSYWIYDTIEECP